MAVKEITDRIPASEATFDMITLGDGLSPRQEKIGNVLVHRVTNSAGLFAKFAFPFIAYLKGRSMIDKMRFECVWPIMASYAGFAAFLLKIHKPTLPVLLTIQEGDHFERRQGIFAPLFRKIFRSADRIQSISSFLAGWSRDMGAVCPIDVIPNAVDHKLFSIPVSEEKRNLVVARLMKKSEDTFIVTTSRLVMKNGVADAISALSFLPKEVKLIVLGTGPLEDELKRQCLRLGLNYTDEPPVNPGNRVHFVGYTPHAEMVAYLAASDIFVRPSLTEGLGNSFLEAMAAGLPVIGTPVGGIPDFLTDGETGLMCEPGNPRSIAQKIEKLMKDKESRDYLVKKAKSLVVERYDWDKIAKDMWTCLNMTMSNK